jgi:hypothetical protein
MNSPIGIAVAASLVGLGLAYAGTRKFLQPSEAPAKYGFTGESARENYDYPAEPDDITHVGGRKKRKKNTKRKKIK